VVPEELGGDGGDVARVPVVPRVTSTAEATTTEAATAKPTDAPVAKQSTDSTDVERAAEDDCDEEEQHVHVHHHGHDAKHGKGHKLHTPDAPHKGKKGKKHNGCGKGKKGPKKSKKSGHIHGHNDHAAKGPKGGKGGAKLATNPRANSISRRHTPISRELAQGISAVASCLVLVVGAVAWRRVINPKINQKEPVCGYQIPIESRPAAVIRVNIDATETTLLIPVGPEGTQMI